MPEEMDPLIDDKRGLFSSLAVAKGKGRVGERRIGTLGFADVNCYRPRQENKPRRSSGFSANFSFFLSFPSPFPLATRLHL